MKISPDTIIKAALVAAGVLLGTGGTLGTQKVISSPTEAKIIQITPECPRIPDVYLDGVKIRRANPSR